MANIKKHDVTEFLELLDDLKMVEDDLQWPPPPQPKHEMALQKRANAIRRLTQARANQPPPPQGADWEHNPNPEGQEAFPLQARQIPAQPRIGDAPGGYVLTDRNHNILDIWDGNITEQQACDKFNSLTVPEQLRRKQIWLIAVNRQGKSMGTLGCKWYTPEKKK